MPARRLWALVTALLLAGCASGAVQAPPAPAPGTVSPADGSAGLAPPGAGPRGLVRVAYPDEPLAWHPALSDQPAVVDVSALTGLPLYHLDPDGQLRPALAERATVVGGDPGGPWVVEVQLRPGTWSDGRPVGAGDVVATVDALRAVRPELEVLGAVRALDETTVRLEFTLPYGRWPHLLAGGWSVLPAHVLADGGLERFRSGLPVSGGPFRLESHLPGLVATLAAHPGSPLGAPALERVELYFTPSFDTALGLIDDHRVDVALGYHALNPVGRAGEVTGLTAAAPVGGTWALIRWDPEGVLGDSPEERAAARGAIDLAELVGALLGDAGSAMTSTVPGLDGPWAGETGAPAGTLEGVDLDLLLPRQGELPSFTGRVLQRELRGAGADVVSLLRVDAEDVDQFPQADGEYVVRRDVPRPSLRGRAPPDADGALLDVLRTGDAAGRPDDEAVRRAQEALFAAGWELPLYRVGVAHVWREQLEGLSPSAWPGLALWDAGSWSWGPDGPPPQEPASGDGAG